MRKKILIGAIIAILLMLMMPMIPAVEFKITKNHQKIISQNVHETIHSFKRQFEKKTRSNNQNNDITEYYALIVGCTEYEQRWNDIPLSESSLKPVYNSLLNAANWKQKNIHLLLNEGATKNNIIDTLNDLSNTIDDNDIFLFSWMGHGTIIKDDDGDESDGTDEAICPYDTKITTDGFQNIITDDELDTCLSTINAKGQFIMFESCMSGGMVDNETSKNITLIDVNKKGRVVVMSTPSGKLGFAMASVGWPISLLYGQALSNQNCDTNNDGWISAEEAFTFVDETYTTFEYNWFSELNDQIMNETIPIAVVIQFLLANKLLKKIISKPLMRALLSGLWALFAYQTYKNEEYREIMLEMLIEMMEKQLEMKGAENNPNMVDDYPNELGIIKIS